jgi:GNAT superfamily N-acetyltransferase
VDSCWQGIGRALLRDAIFRVLQAAEIAGVRAILVHAISENAKQFYEQCGFTVSPVDPMTLIVKVDDAFASLGL